jgi:putative transposase
MDYYGPLLSDNMYHIISHAVGNEKLFLNDDNYKFFLKRYNKYITPIADTFAYSLLPNHFHFLIQIKPYPELQQYYKIIKPHGKEKEGWQPDFVMQQISNLLNSYAKSFNKKNNRKGALFMDYLRRVEVTTDAQYGATVFYIHKNAVHHGYCKAIPAGFGRLIKVFSQIPQQNYSGKKYWNGLVAPKNLLNFIHNPFI